MRRSSRAVLIGFTTVVLGCGSSVVHGTRGPDADGGRAVDALPQDDAPADEGAPLADAPRVPLGNTCDDAIPVPVVGRLVVAPPERTEATSAMFTDNPILRDARYVRWYRVSVPPGVHFEARPEASEGGYPAVVGGFTRCAAEAWVVRARDESERGVLAWPNVGDAPRDLYFAVTAPGPQTRAATLALSARPIAPNGFCATPTVVSDRTALTGEDLHAAGEPAGLCFPPTAMYVQGAALHYRAHVRAGETLFASHRADPANPHHFVGYVHVREQCGDGACLAPSQWGLGGWRRVATAWTNDGPSRDVLVTVQGLINVDVHTAAVTFRVAPPALNTRCEVAAPLAPDIPQEVNVASASRTAVPCVWPETRQAAFYTVDVPARATLEVTALPLEGVSDEVRVVLFAGCARPACLAQGDSGARPDAAATFVNGAEATAVTVAVTGIAAHGRAPFLARVTARVRP